MRLARGARLGRYEVVDWLGAGGMGEVYKARDTRLDRTVAIKVLPPHVAADEGRRARFESEARVISRLNHPHICVLHDVGHQDGIDFLVMEYLEGETLARRLEKGPLPLEQVLRYGIEIADALARAHKQGIVHRDLKPGNVMLTKSGAKLLDFGLAKAALVRPSAQSDVPTGTRSLTPEGTLLGTVLYMSPEQLEGKRPDDRSDIWALGCVLYEMGTGRHAFNGKSQASLFAVALPGRPVLTQPALALSPDGTRLVFSGGFSGTGPLYLRALDQAEATPIPGTQGGSGPFFSPDGRWIGFFAGDTLCKVDLEGGAPITLCEAVNPRGGAWGPDDSIVFAPGTATGLYRVFAGGGRPQAITHVDRARQEHSHRWPAFLPDGKAVLFIVESRSALIDETVVSAVVLATGERREILRAGTFPRYFAGFLLFARTGMLVASPFDLRRLAVTGPPAPVIENVVTYGGSRSAHYATSANGTRAYLAGPAVGTGVSSLVWVDRSGRVQPSGLPPRHYTTPRLSPDGQRVTADVDGPSGSDIWVGDLGHGALRRLTFTGADNETPAWTPDGARIVYASGRPGQRRAILRKRADGSEAEETLLTSHHHLHVNSLSADGRQVVFSDFGAQGEDPADLGVLALQSEGGKAHPRGLFQTLFSERAGRLSPDSRWLAYTSNESGRDEVYVRPFAGPGGQVAGLHRRRRAARLGAQRA